MGISFLTSPLSCLQQLDKMRGFIVALALISACAAVSRDAQWEEFKLTFKKGYRNLEQESERKGIFMAHLDAIEAHNAKYEAGLSTYQQGVNQFSDLTFEEFENTVLMREQSYVQGENKAAVPRTPKFHPDSHDWRDENVLGAVKNQGQCGSCWAFGAVGAVEAQWAIAGNAPEILSEQMLVDCGAGDCNGGWADRAFDTIIDQGGDCREEDYPYTAHNGHGCKSFTPVVSISGYNFMNVKSEGIDALAESIYNNGPHTVYVYANSNFQRYHSGIFDDSSCSTSSYNHAVINIGYDVNEGYWTIRNSWASSWGEQGHIRMARGKNTCNIEHYAWVPYL